MKPNYTCPICEHPTETADAANLHYQHCQQEHYPGKCLVCDEPLGPEDGALCQNFKDCWARLQQKRKAEAIQ